MRCPQKMDTAITKFNACRLAEIKFMGLDECSTWHEFQNIYKVNDIRGGGIRGRGGVAPFTIDQPP